MWSICTLGDSAVVGIHSSVYIMIYVATRWNFLKNFDCFILKFPLIRNFGCSFFRYYFEIQVRISFTGIFFKIFTTERRVFVFSKTRTGYKIPPNKYIKLISTIVTSTFRHLKVSSVTYYYTITCLCRNFDQLSQTFEHFTTEYLRLLKM